MSSNTVPLGVLASDPAVISREQAMLTSYGHDSLSLDFLRLSIRDTGIGWLLIQLVTGSDC